jgi:hypothetical protein
MTRWNFGLKLAARQPMDIVKLDRLGADPEWKTRSGFCFSCRSLLLLPEVESVLHLFFRLDLLIADDGH